MKERFFVVALVVCSAVNVKAQADKFSLSAVSEAIKTKASIITHLETIDVKVESLDKCVRKVHKVYTVLNEEGKSGLYFGEYSSKTVSLDDVELKVYDSNGK